MCTTFHWGPLFIGRLVRFAVSKEAFIYYWNRTLPTAFGGEGERRCGRGASVLLSLHG